MVNKSGSKLVICTIIVSKEAQDIVTKMMTGKNALTFRQYEIYVSRIHTWFKLPP